MRSSLLLVVHEAVGRAPAAAGHRWVLVAVLVGAPSGVGPQNAWAAGGAGGVPWTVVRKQGSAVGPATKLPPASGVSARGAVLALLAPFIMAGGRVCRAAWPCVCACSSSHHHLICIFHTVAIINAPPPQCISGIACFLNLLDHFQDAFQDGNGRNTPAANRVHAWATNHCRLVPVFALCNAPLFLPLAGGSGCILAPSLSRDGVEGERSSNPVCPGNIR